MQCEASLRLLTKFKNSVNREYLCDCQSCSNIDFKDCKETDDDEEGNTKPPESEADQDDGVAQEQGVYELSMCHHSYL